MGFSVLTQNVSRYNIANNIPITLSLTRIPPPKKSQYTLHRSQWFSDSINQRFLRWTTWIKPSLAVLYPSFTHYNPTVMEGTLHPSIQQKTGPTFPTDRITHGPPQHILSDINKWPIFYFSLLLSCQVMRGILLSQIHTMISFSHQ